MTKTEQQVEWSRAAAVKSVFLFIFNILFLIAVMFGSVIFEKRNAFFTTFKAHRANYLYICLCAIMLSWLAYFYLFFEHRKILTEASSINLIFFTMAVCIFLSSLAEYYGHIYVRPVALFALLIFMLVGRREAIFFNIVYGLLVFVVDYFSDLGETEPNVCSALLLTFVAGMMAVFVAGKMKNRVHIFPVGFAIILPMELLIMLLEICTLATGASGQLTTTLFVKDKVLALLKQMGYGLLGGLFSVVGFFVILPMFEVMFNRLTDFRLRELTSGDAKLLKKLKTEAPGTYNHSVVVAQLAEACAVALGENVDAARAAGFYHDVGKLHQPEYFTENQGEYNLHEELTPELSADIIRSHSIDGFDLIRANHLPQFLADVAVEHHGTMPIRYFYAKALKMTDGELNIEDFSYTGPKPQSKIAAIVMIADASEAVARSMQTKDPVAVEKAVRDVIEERMDLEQFAECDITIMDLSVIKQTLVDTLTGVYHHRVAYPSIRYKRGEKGNTQGEIK